MAMMEKDFIKGSSIGESLVSGIAAAGLDLAMSATPLGANPLVLGLSEIGVGLAGGVIAPAGMIRTVATNAGVIPGFLHLGQLILGTVVGRAKPAATGNSGIMAV